MDQVSLCNLALARLGAQSAISSLNEGSPEATYCGQFWDQARDATLAAHDWPFAKAVSPPLASIGTPPATWQQQYALPADCVRLRHIQNPLGVQATQMEALGYDAMPIIGAPFAPVPFERGLGTDALGNQAAVLWTNQAAAVLVYTARVTNTDLWEPGFIAAFSWQLAMELAMPVTGSGQLQDAMARGFQSALDAAKNSTANERTRIDTHLPEWLRVRGLPVDELAWPLLTQQSLLPQPSS